MRVSPLTSSRKRPNLKLKKRRKMRMRKRPRMLSRKRNSHTTFSWKRSSENQGCTTIRCQDLDLIWPSSKSTTHACSRVPSTMLLLTTLMSSRESRTKKRKRRSGKKNKTRLRSKRLLMERSTPFQRSSGRKLSQSPMTPRKRLSLWVLTLWVKIESSLKTKSSLLWDASKVTETDGRSWSKKTSKPTAWRDSLGSRLRDTTKKLLRLLTKLSSID